MQKTPVSTNTWAHRILQVQLYTVAAVAVSSGLLELTLGLDSQNLFGAAMADELLTNPFLASQFRFIAAMWLGVGLMLLGFVQDIGQHARPVRLILGMLTLGGLSRLVTMVQVGLPEDSLASAYIISVCLGEVSGGVLGLFLTTRISES